MGWKAQPTAQVNLTDCLIESDDLLGEELKDKEDYQAKKIPLQDIQMDPNTLKDEKLKKELMRR